MKLNSKIPLIEVNNFDSYFMTMQNRERPSKRWFEAWKKSMRDSSNSYWTETEGYVQTCPFNVQKCWQNFVYHDIVPNTFNLKTLYGNKIPYSAFDFGDTFENDDSKYLSFIKFLPSEDKNKINFNFTKTSNQIVKIVVVDVETGLTRDTFINQCKKLDDGNYMWWTPMPGRLENLGDIDLLFYLDDEYSGVDCGVILDVTTSAGVNTLEYTTSSTGFDATLLYSINYFS